MSGKDKRKTLYDLIKEKKKSKVLKYHQYLSELKKEIGLMGFVEKDIECYRVVHKPTTSVDYIPQKFKPDRKDRLKIYTIEKWNTFSIDDKRRYISSCSLSHFLSEDGCIKMMQNRYKNDLNRMKPEEALERKRLLGTHIVKMNYKKGDGLWGNEKDGHIEFLEYDDFDYTKRMDYKFGYKELPE